MKLPLAITISVMLAMAVMRGAAAGEPGGSASPFALTDEDRPTFPISAERTNFRAGMMDWIYDRNTAAGWISDFVLPGSELPLHLDVDPGNKERRFAFARQG